MGGSVEGSSTWPATFTRCADTSNKVTGPTAGVPRRKASALTFHPEPTAVTIPAPVITTRGMEELWQETGKSTNPIPIAIAILKESQDKSNAAVAKALSHRKHFSEVETIVVDFYLRVREGYGPPSSLRIEDGAQAGAGTFSRASSTLFVAFPRE